MMVGHVKEKTAQKPCKCGKYGLFVHLHFSLDWKIKIAQSDVESALNSLGLLFIDCGHASYASIAEYWKQHNIDKFIIVLMRICCA